MDRLVGVDIKELELTFKRGQRSTTTFRLTNLMHTMSVAVSLSTSKPSLFSFDKPFSILSPLSNSSFSLLLTNPSDHPSLSSISDSLFVRTVMLPTGKATSADLRRLFSKPGRHVFNDATIPISFVGDHVVEFLLNSPPIKTLEIGFLLSKAISGCSKFQLTSLLRSAVKLGNANFVSALIDAGGDVNDRDSDEGRSMMSVAVCSGHIDVVRVLIASGCEIDYAVDRLLHDAAALNRVDLMKILCGGGGSKINVNSPDSNGRTAVHVSAIHGHVDVLRFCVSVAGGDPDYADSNGWTPLHCAAAEGQKEAVEFLLDSSFYAKYAVTKDGKVPFDLAIDNGNAHLLNLLRLNDVMHRAARMDDVHGMKSCLAQGANVNDRDLNGWTPLHRAAFKGRIESVKLLLSNGAQVDVVDDAGYTPLHCAVEAGQTQVALYLIAHGAITTLKSVKGVRTLNLDSFKNHPALVLPLNSEKERA